MSDTLEMPEVPEEEEGNPRPETWEQWRLRKGRIWAWVFGWDLPLRWAAYRSKNFGFVRILDVISKFAIIVAIGQFLAESGERRDTRHNAAWSLIMGAKGATGDGGRRYALEQLVRDGVSLVGLPLSHATIEELDLTGGRLTYADLTYTILVHPVFRYADMDGAYFMSTKMVKPDFTGANLRDTNFCLADIKFSEDPANSRYGIIIGPVSRAVELERAFVEALRHAGLPEKNNDCTFTVDGDTVQVSKIVLRKDLLKY